MTVRRIKIVQRFHIFIASKRVGFSFDIKRSRKILKSLLHNIYLMLKLLYHKRNPLNFLVLRILESCIEIKNYFFLSVRDWDVKG